MNTFADVVLPLPLYKYFTYRIPADWQASLQPGSRVVVPFGRKKYYTAIVTRLHDVMPQGYEVKEILSILDDRPILRRPQLQFWEWIADYYLCSVGDVYKAALPSGLKLESETTVTLNTEFEEPDDDRLKEREWMLLTALSKKSRMTVQELEKESGMHNVLPTLRLLLEREAVFVSEQIKAHYRPKTETYIRLAFAPIWLVVFAICHPSFPADSHAGKDTKDFVCVIDDIIQHIRAHIVCYAFCSTIAKTHIWTHAKPPSLAKYKLMPAYTATFDARTHSRRYPA